MLRKLRLRVIIISMISVAAVLTVIIGSVNVLNYRNIIREADAILSVLGDNGGTFPQGREQDALKEVFSGDISRELPYETRFFSVTMDRRGNTKDIDIGRIASVDAQTAEKYAAEIIGSGKEHGFMDNYRYLNCDTEEGKTVIFLDCSRTLLSFRNFFLFSVLVSAFGLAAVTVLIILFSGRIVRPLMRSYEKQKEFITNAGHELKTPLTIIRADSELLKMEYGENEWLADIRNQSDRLCGLTDDLIRLSRMEEEPRNFSGSTVCLSDLIEETAGSFQAPARVQEKLFQYETAEGLTVFGDKKNLRELISILLDNALKYSGVRGKIRLEAPYHALTNGGHISYVELDGDPLKNLDAFESVVRFMKESGIGYGSINHPVDRDPVCGFTGIIDNECPHCHRTEDDGKGNFERIRRITGYLVGTLDRFNDAKRAEVEDRVKHSVMRTSVASPVQKQ